jgi:Flp pilus assembly protein TadG
MQTVKNQRGSVIVFITLMIVLLMVMVGLGLDTGQLGYTRNMGQAAVDSAALSAVTGLPSRNAGETAARAADFNSKNDYTGSSMNLIAGANLSYVKYDFASNTITNYNEPIGTANGVRVALEGGNSMKTPVFLTPLVNLFGTKTSGVQNVNVSAVSVIRSKPALPIALWLNQCSGSGTDVKIRMQHPDQKDDGTENACWTTFLDCSAGAPDIKAGFQVADTCSGSPINGDITIGTPICQNKGQVNTVMKTAEEFFLNDHPNRWWMIPVIQGTKNCAAKDPTPIVNWAKIYPKQVVRTGNPKYILADVVCDPNLPNELETSLCFSHRLVREPSKGY